MRQTRTGIVALCCLSLSGCYAEREALSPHEGSAANSSGNLNFDAYEPPPDSPPTAAIGPQTLRPSQYYWRIDGRMQEEAPKSDAAVAVNDITRAHWNQPHIDIGTSQRPLRARLVTYQLTKAGGVPASDDGRAIDCEKSQQSCSLDQKKGRIFVRTGLDLNEFTVATLTMEFATLESLDLSEGVRSYVVSWVIRGDS